MEAWLFLKPSAAPRLQVMRLGREQGFVIGLFAPGACEASELPIRMRVIDSSLGREKEALS